MIARTAHTTAIVKDARISSHPNRRVRTYDARLGQNTWLLADVCIIYPLEGNHSFFRVEVFLAGCLLWLLLVSQFHTLVQAFYSYVIRISYPTSYKERPETPSIHGGGEWPKREEISHKRAFI